jgi:glycopeptide antibiotics resistance protein
VHRPIFTYLAAFAWILGWGVFGLPRRRISVTPRWERLDWFAVFYANPVDMVLNFVYYVAFGIIATRLGATPRLAIILAALLSATTEFSQLFSRSRYPSLVDLLVNTAGAAAGVALIYALQRRPVRA